MKITAMVRCPANACFPANASMTADGVLNLRYDATQKEVSDAKAWQRALLDLIERVKSGTS